MDSQGLAHYFEFEVKDGQVIFYRLQELKEGTKLTPKATRPATPQEIEMWDHIQRTNGGH